MSVFDSAFDETVTSWVLVYFTDSDPGKEFEIIPRTRISVQDNVELRPRLRVKVFYGKAKLEAYVVRESGDYYYLKENFKSLASQYTQDMVLNSIFVYDAEFQQKWECSLAEIEEVQVPAANGTMVLDPAVILEQYNTLKVRFDDLYRVQNEMRSTIVVLVERVQALTEKCERNEKNKETKDDTKDKTETKDKADTKDKTDDKKDDKKTEKTPKPKEKEVEEVEEEEDDDDMVYIGENRTPIPKDVYQTINWNSCSAATRKLLMAVFSKDILATHSLTGKPSPAFLNANKETKKKLDATKTSDIIDIVTRRCRVPATAVRNAITTKCADENKMCKKRKLRHSQ
ncbi:early boundary activity protein 1-like [Atheta coriaria]|uniref:early boundary activity protein 1-like n=1 Tax=Dalotia coriaria TaxID=877792 RepID=UPI0031F46761